MQSKAVQKALFFYKKKKNSFLAHSLHKLENYFSLLVHGNTSQFSGFKMNCFVIAAVSISTLASCLAYYDEIDCELTFNRSHKLHILVLVT